MAKRKTSELDMTLAARLPMLMELVEDRNGHSIRPRFNDDEEIVGWSVYEGDYLVRGFHTRAQARRFASKRNVSQNAACIPTPKFLSSEYVGSFL